MANIERIIPIFHCNFKGLAQCIDAVVSLEGTINDSPLANQAADIYSKLDANLAISRWLPATGGLSELKVPC